MARPTLKEHYKFKRLVRMLGIPTPHAVGYLECLWHVGYTSGDPFVGDSLSVEAAAEWVGEPGKFTEALLQSAFIDQVSDSTYQIHDLHDHAPDYVQKRYKREQERKNKELRQETADNGGQRRTMAENVRPPTPAPAPAPTLKNLPSEDMSSGDDPSGVSGEFLQVWNSAAKDIGWSAIREVTPSRRQTIRKRLRNKFWREHWREALDRIRGSPFCKGENDRGWVAEPDWFLRPNTVTAILEGKYDPKANSSELPF